MMNADRISVQDSLAEIEGHLRRVADNLGKPSKEPQLRNQLRRAQEDLLDVLIHLNYVVGTPALLPPGTANCSRLT